MTTFGNPASGDVRALSPGLVAILAAGCESGAICRKQVAAAADFSLTTAYRVCDHGWREYDQIQGLVDRLPEAQSLAIASDLCRRFSVQLREVDAKPAGVAETLALAGGAVNLATTIHAADADRVRTPDERARIQQLINDLRRGLDEIEAANRPPAPARVRVRGGVR